MSLFNLLKGAGKTAPPEPETPVSEAVADESPFAELTPLEPAAVEPSAVEPVAIEPVAIEPATVATAEPDLSAFDSEFAAPAAVVEGASASAIGVADDDGELEEWSEPLASVAPPLLEAGARIENDEGLLTIEEALETRGGENVYRGTWLVSDADAGTVPVTARLRQASGDWGERLARETMWRAHWEEGGRLAMLPRVVCSFKDGDLTYLATELPTSGPTLSQFFAAHEAATVTLPAEEREARESEFLGETLLLLVQIAAFLVRLHEAGFAHLGLRADGIVLGKPVQILDCSFAAPLGEPLETPLSLAGYSASELLKPGKVDARSDLYGVGALLYRAVTGENVPESGADFLSWKPRIAMAGVPQILARTLGEADTRFNSAPELHRALVKIKARLKPSVSHALCGLSTVGLEPSRITNQDAFGSVSGAWETESGPLAWSAFVVADGMGGMAAGEVASEVAVQTFLDAASSWIAATDNASASALPAPHQAQLVKEWAALANGAVVNAMQARGARGGCTIDAGLVIDKRLAIAHVGDGRFYLLRGGEYELLSRDHSFVMSLLLQGEISFEELRTHGDRNKVTRSLGERHPQPDYFIDTLQVQKQAPTIELQRGDVLLACSDGLWEPVVESEMLAAIGAGDLNGAARALLRLALQRGAPDNATLVLFRLDEEAAPVFG